MDTQQIKQALRTRSETRGLFAGVFAANRLPLAPLRRPAILVVNSQADFFPGSHWLCFYLPSHEIGVEYFDSLGAAPTLHYFLSFINRNGGLLRYNRLPLQHAASDVCGEFCCVFALERASGASLQHFLTPFSTRREENDRLVLLKFNTYFSCNVHYYRPELRAFHVQTCASQCHTRARRCTGSRARTSRPRLRGRPAARSLRGAARGGRRGPPIFANVSP